MQILIIDPDESTRLILKINLLKYTKLEYVEKRNFSEAIEVLRVHSEFNLIICRDPNVGEQLKNFLCQEKISINIFFINTTLTWENTASQITKMLGVGQEDETLEYLPVNVNYFLDDNFYASACDIYIRIKKGSSYQYVKRLHSADHFTKQDIQKYIDSGLKYFYIERKVFSQLLGAMTTQIVSKLADKKIQAEERILATTESYEVTLECIHALGINSHVVTLVEESLNSMEKSIGESNSLSVFLKTLRNNPLSYGYAHSYLCSLILYKVIEQFDWNSIQVKKKLTYVAFFHDISLSDMDLMKVVNNKDLESLSGPDQRKVENHALQSALLIDSFPNIPQGIGTILKEHHGSKNGIGFPEELSIAIAPLSMMFVVVESFVDEVLKIRGIPTVNDLKKIFDTISPRYNKVTYLQTVVALQIMVQNKE
jgi:hypothetical protein